MTEKVSAYGSRWNNLEKLKLFILGIHQDLMKPIARVVKMFSDFYSNLFIYVLVYCPKTSHSSGIQQEIHLCAI